MLHDLQIFRSSQNTIGTWFSLGSSIIAEMAAVSGVQWGLFDHEQGSAPESVLPENLRAVGAGKLIPLVRIGRRSAEAVTRALNWGAAGIMYPHVENAEDAQRCVQMAHYPPRGVRGISRSTRATAYGAGHCDVKNNPPAPLVVVQIESLEGVRNVSSIAAVEGVDMLFVGPADLSFDLSVSTDEGKLTYEQCLEATVRAARAHGKSAGILVRNPSDIPQLRALGFNHLAIDSDMGILRRRYAELAEMSRKN